MYEILLLKFPKTKLAFLLNIIILLKHCRFSETIDFGKEWADYSCSKEYFKTISPVFGKLRDMKIQGMFFRDIKDKDTIIYLPILIAFED
ncbi:MAG: hypothetical protein C4617_01180 [Candidatus Liberibacter europaeus]|uniref:Uncharacterized protein n=1 Tax=Candidatus Liberibacter europaeus TaxID=744859 RepID=A0A2T4VZ39_9HYPH|nr:hypothetical protein [Candidatus Liberibacter europaeus]PTL87044.1 MAG: hypothetical protein C4617_01180 [Candidatus Liberibacter europaeus]